MSSNDDTSSDRTSSDRTSSDRTSSDRTSSDRTSSDRTSSDDTTAPTESHPVCSVDDLEVGQARQFEVNEHRIAVIRGKDRWFAIDDECSHADYSLAEGDVDLEECTIECWKHGSLFSLVTGEPETLPATRAVATYAVTVEAGEVAVELPRLETRAETSDE